MNEVFFDENGRLRSGWRAAFFAALFTIAVIVLTSIVGAVVPSSPDSPRVSVAIRAAVMVIPAIGIGLLCAHVFEGLGADGIGISLNWQALTNFAKGIAVGILTLLTAVLPTVLGGNLTFAFNAVEPTSLFISLAVFGIAAAWEEAVFRGYILQTLARSGYAWLAIVLTAAFFGLGHAGNPAATIISVLNTVLAGIWFGVAYLRTRDLWFVWAMHLAWNFTQGSVLGIEVSGLMNLSGTTLFRETDVGPTWLTGTAYGVEGSISTTIAIALSALAIHYAPGSKRDRELRDLDLETNVDGTRRMG